MKNATLEAGREMDALVAEKVMGYEWERVPEDDYAILRVAGTNWAAMEVNRGVVHYSLLPNFSTDITDAWPVVEKMREREWLLNLHEEGGKSMQWVACFMDAEDEQCDSGEELAQTAPLAICRAALAALAPHVPDGGE